MAKKAKLKAEGKKTEKSKKPATKAPPPAKKEAATTAGDGSAAAAPLSGNDDLDIRYGTLLVGDDKSKQKKKPQLKHLLEKADANKQRLEELKKESTKAANKEMMKRAILQVCRI